MAWKLPVGIDHCIPGTSRERLQPALAIAMQLLYIWKQFGMRPPSVKERHCMLASQRCLNKMATQKASPAKNKNPHAFLSLSPVRATQKSRTMLWISVRHDQADHRGW